VRNGRSRRAERQEEVADGYEAAGKSFKVHLDGYDQRDRAGPSKSARNTSTGHPALRSDRWRERRC